ncbi:DUF1622 domain-containing protein [Streptomyces sp. NBC_01294]|uniref:DUF1622 domain-containing protein n=1 Tax=Streptomyces sp. NBC_01294 TaxID=2903815 RepID=UPI002DD9EA73|nr:DUF1622 domain-containing protein [Streptomyces sp. NBC_01294]WRZ61045.1 DUF1622 domain-containing protein [Streptomyces sp. NBC_01294]
MSIEVLPESWLSDAIDLLARIVESIGALIIFVGAVWAFGRFLAVLVKDHGRERKYNQIRLNLSRFIALGLEFQLAADVLRTAVAPTFTDIGQLAAIAAIRTALNYFLAKEIDRESAEVEQDRQETSKKDRQDQLPPA